MTFLLVEDPLGLYTLRSKSEANAEANAELRVAEHLVQSQGTQNKSLPVSSATINFTPGVPNSIVV